MTVWRELRVVPSRRQVLAAVGGVGAAGTAGCLTDLGVARTGYLQFKIVDVAWTHRGQRWQSDVLYANYDGRRKVFCRVAEEYRGIVNSLDDIRVSDGVLDRLTDDFEDVRYVAGFCFGDPEGSCQNPQASRETFDAVQFGDRAEVVLDHPSVHVVDVYEGAQSDPADWETTFRTFDFSESHADNGVPID